MPSRLRDLSLKSRLPVSTEVTQRPVTNHHGNRIGFNRRHMNRLIRELVDHYGWTLCKDGNLYAPFPNAAQEENSAA